MKKEQRIGNGNQEFIINSAHKLERWFKDRSRALRIELGV